MRYGDIERFCLSLPAAVLSVQWGGTHVFKIGGKMFAMLCPPEQRPHVLCFKTSETSFYILTHLPHIIPAPYLARAGWVLLERLDALGTKEIRGYLIQAHRQVAAKLPKKKQTALGLEQTVQKTPAVPPQDRPLSPPIISPPTERAPRRSKRS